MTTPTYPGVYVQEVSSGVRPLQAASTSVVAFIGQAERGPIDKAEKVFNFTEYQNLYGGFVSWSYLSHAVLQFFNNGGAQCYIVRVTGSDTQTANIVLNDRHSSPAPSLTISASSPGEWGNRLAIVITNGSIDADNEFNLYVYWQDETVPLEAFENLSMVPTAPNFVERVTATSNYIRVSVNTENPSEASGTSRGAKAPSPLTDPGKTKLRININGDGYQEIDLQVAVDEDTTLSELTTAANIAQAIQFMVTSKLGRKKASTDQTAFSNFKCDPDNTTNVLVLTSGFPGPTSSVNVAPANNPDEDATGFLALGPRHGGTETLGAAVNRPLNNPEQPPANYYLVGDHDHVNSTEVADVRPGNDGASVSGDGPYTDAFTMLDDKQDVSLIAVPGMGSPNIVGEGMNYCANRRPLSDCFFIGDMRAEDDEHDEAEAFIGAISPKNSYGAVYTPWIQMTDPTGQSDEPILVPPSGYIAGLYARTDAQRGVWKAPAGTGAALGGAVGLKVNFTDVQQGNLNPRNVNVIRQFPASGIVPWGARTVTSDPEWRYISVRRTAIFLRVSIYNGIQWAVFEPNDEDLWASLRLNIGSFMMTLFRQGAFQGAMPSEAFFVKCDSETTTQAHINNGIVNVLVGFAPLKPAEFVVVKISQMAGQSF